MPYLNDMPLEARIALLNRRDAGKTAQDILKPALTLMKQKIALVSSFGADSAVLLHMVVQIAPKTPVLFIDTMKLFRATLSYQKQLANHLGLEHVNHLSPDPGRVFLQDTEGLLHQSNTDACCTLRKVEPLQQSLSPFSAWITEPQAVSIRTRADLSIWEADAAGRLKLNPLTHWSKQDIAAYFETHNLPRHPLNEKGYPSIGCAPCTFRAPPGMHARAGRLAGQSKTECGIHLPVKPRNT
jgi:phosphoadenosine phosphosulfate reductase